MQSGLNLAGMMWCKAVSGWSSDFRTIVNILWVIGCKNIIYFKRNNNLLGHTRYAKKYPRRKKFWYGIFHSSTFYMLLESRSWRRQDKWTQYFKTKSENRGLRTYARVVCLSRQLSEACYSCKMLHAIHTERIILKLLSAMDIRTSLIPKDQKGSLI